MKHRPHISKNLLPQKEEKEEGPDTASTDFYNAQKDKFQKDFDEFPKKHNLYQPRRQTKKNEDLEEKAASQDFEPYRTYAQVRKTITKKRLPKKKKTDPRLRESIKDSKIHTVYSEEGYQDSAYDHGDQEKQAERAASRRKVQIRKISPNHHLHQARMRKALRSTKNLINLRTRRNQNLNQKV